MAIKNTYQSYGSVSKFFHWIIVLLVFGMLIYGFLMGYLPKEYKGLGYNIHKLTGLTILTLMILRTLWALKNPKPRLPSGAPLWQIAAERLMHFGFYVVLLAMPVVGWVMSSAAQKAPHLWGYSLALPMGKNKALAHQMSTIHEILAYVIIAMIVIHVAAALRHHFVKKDNILVRMLPGKTTSM